jgi:integrase/recombinase XerD
MARVNITRQVKTEIGWRNVSLLRDGRGRIQWGSGVGRYLIEWYEEGRRRRLSAGSTPSEALEAQRQKRLELDARAANVKLALRVDENEDDDSFRLESCLSAFLKDVEAFRKPATHERYKFILELFSDHIAPKKDVREITAEDIKAFLAWRKSKGFDPGTTLYTDRVILHNFFSKQKIDNPVKEVPRLKRMHKKPLAYMEEELKKFFAACNDWDKAFFGLALSTGLRRGELKTLHWSDLDLSGRQVHVTAKPEYDFVPKDWEERSVPLTHEVAGILRKHPRHGKCALVFPSSNGKPNYRFLHDRCKAVAKQAKLDPKEWHLHRFRDTAATRWLRAGVDVRTVQTWLGHESLDTTQKYLEPSKETDRQLNRIRLPL